MSPEQARDSGAADARSDLYSLGGTWFHLLTGQAPFPAGGLGERLIKIMNDPPPDVCALNPRVSPACRAVLERLLAKDPEDRYPSAESLIDDLLSLEGQTSRRLKPTADSPKRNKKRSNAQVHSLEASSTPADSNPWPWIYAGGGAVLALVLLVVVLVASRRGNPDQPVNPGEPIVLLPPVITMPQTPPVPRPQRPTASDKTPSRTALPRLGNAVLDPVALKQEADHPWAKAEPWSAPIRKVRRVSAEPGTFRCLADALAAPGPAIVEIADNGPFFELPIDLGEREVWIRAAPGFRPLLIWDLPATMEKRRLNKKTDQPLYFWRGRSGRLLLEGLDVAWQIPETLAESFVVLDRSAGEVHLRDCTFSSTGKPRERATLLRVVSPDSGSRLRLERCHLRMRGVQLLHLDAPAAHVRIDNCLITSSEATLLLLRNG
ncbi:MAG: serine/threonine-protein kinase, partial [Gemmataceae bacterium]